MTDTPLVERLRGLIERLEKLEGPDREVDEAILLALDDEYNVVTRYYDAIVGWEQINGLSGRSYAHPAPLSASLDAAVALVERVLPGARWDVSTTGMRPGATVISYGNPLREGAYAATPAIALVIATLRALSQEQSK